MQADLSHYSHTKECNFLIDLLKRCYADHPVGRFFGYCDKEGGDVALCCHAERILKRKNNPRYSPRPVEGWCLPESSYTPALKKLKQEGILIIKPEDCKEPRFRNTGVS